MTASGRPARRPTPADSVLGPDDTSLLDVVDNALSKGVVLTGDVTLALADVELVYLRLSVLLCAADRVLPGEPQDVAAHRRRRATARRTRRPSRT